LEIRKIRGYEDQENDIIWRSMTIRIRYFAEVEDLNLKVAN